ncbi:MAG: hypothetical protein M1819_002769 [Sarea resinae]|nr:MAG: hypothetical protein M1819_002769 [Sarea resinae]
MSSPVPPSRPSKPFLLVSLAGFTGVGIFYLLGRYPPRTFGVQNIEGRFSSGGGSDGHTPGSATPTGYKDKVQGNQTSAGGIKLPGHEEGYQDANEGSFDRIRNEMSYKTERKGKDGK